MTTLFSSETVCNSNHISTQTRLNVSEMVFCHCTYLKKKMQTTTTEEEDINRNISPYLFILALETLLTAIKQNQDIKGIVVEDKEIKCIAFADDLTNLMRDKESYASLSLLLSTYGQCSGLKLNQDKKEAYWLGNSLRNHEVLDINKVNEPIKILGIFFSYDQLKSKEFMITDLHFLTLLS